MDVANEVNQNQSQTKDVLRTLACKLIESMGFQADVGVDEHVLEDEAVHIVSVRSPQELGVLIGKNGQNIGAIEHVLRLMAYKEIPKNLSVVLDINDYRKSRASFIVDQARVVAARVEATKKAEALSPMSSYERRLVHVELASRVNLITESVGEEPKRRVVVRSLL